MKTKTAPDRSIKITVLSLPALLLLTIGTAPGSEAAWLELHQRAKDARELWTVLQVEAALNSLENPPRLREAFDDHIVPIGDLRLTFPSRIITHTDLGDRVLVLAGNKVYQLDGNGWPFELPVSLPKNIDFNHGSARFSEDGRTLGFVRGSGGWPPPAVELLGVDLTTGDVKLRTTIAHKIPLGAEENLGIEHVCVSPDGSHMAVELRAHIQNRGGVLLVNPNGHQFIPNWRHPRTIARDGAWFAAVNPNWQLRALHGPDKPVASMPEDPGHTIIGPGMLAFGNQFLDPNGDLHSLNLPAGCSAHGMERRGSWLIVEVAPGPPETKITDEGVRPRPLLVTQQQAAKTKEPEQTSVDLFAAIGAEPQPDTTQPAEPIATEPTAESGMVWFSWDDLAADPTSPPRHAAAGDGTLAHTPGSVVRINGSTLERLTPAGDALLREEIITLDVQIQGVWRDKSYLVLELPNHERAVVEPMTGALLGRFEQPAGHHTGIPRQGFAGVSSPRDGDQRIVTIHRLDADPAERWSRTLAIPEPFTHFSELYVHHDEGHSLMVINQDQHWLVLDTETNEVTQRGRPDERRPHFGHIDWSSNRFNRRWEFARLVAIPESSNDVSTLADATLTGSTLLTVDNIGTTMAHDLRRGEITELGSLRNARRFSWSGSSKVPYIANTEGAIIGRIDGRSVTEYAGRNARRPDETSWQIQDRRFTLPGRSAPMNWSQDTTGFRPIRLRGPTKAQMLVILPHNVLVCDRTGMMAMSEPARR